MKEVATIILNRNLPYIVDKLVDKLKKYDNNISDFYVVEAGSDINKLSKYATWHLNTPEVIRLGLRFPRGMNYGLYKLWKEKIFFKYKAFLLLTNDTQVKNKPFIEPLFKELNKHSKLGILSPCGHDWAEKRFLGKLKTKYLITPWHVMHLCISNTTTIVFPKLERCWR